MPRVKHLGAVTGSSGSTPVLDLAKGGGGNVVTVQFAVTGTVTGKFETSPGGDTWVSMKRLNADSLIEGVTANTTEITTGMQRFVRGTNTAGTGTMNYYMILD